MRDNETPATAGSGGSGPAANLADTTALVLCLTALASYYIYFTVVSMGTSDPDSLVRGMYAQRAFRHRWILVDPWARPLGVIPYLPMALVSDVQRGFAAGKALSCAYSLLACIFLAFAARAMKIRHYWLALIALGAQPILCEMSVGINSETVFVVVFALALWCHGKRWIRAEVLCYAMLPLARFENIVLFLPVAFYLLWRARRPWLLLLLCAPTAVWYLMVARLRSDLFWMLAYGEHMATQCPWAFDREMRWATSGADPLHYFYLAPCIFGLPVLFLATVRLIRRVDIFSLYLVCMVGFHCVFKGRAGHAGYPRHIAPVAPLLALFAVQGIACLEAGLGRVHAVVVRFGAAIAIAATCVLLCPPLQPEQPATEIRQQAAQYLLTHAPTAPYLASEVWIDYFLDRNWCDRPRMTPATLDAAPIGTYVFWDASSTRPAHNVRLEAISLDPHFQLVAVFPPEAATRVPSFLGMFGVSKASRQKGYAVHLFKKVAASSPKTDDKPGEGEGH